MPPAEAHLIRQEPNLPEVQLEEGWERPKKIEAEAAARKAAELEASQARTLRRILLIVVVLAAAAAVAITLLR